MNIKTKLKVLAAAAGLAATAMALPGVAGAAPLPAGYTCVGGSNCGTLGANGVVTASPQGGDYGYVSTNGAIGNNGNLGIGSETNSSVARSPTFGAATTDALNFYFNYVTSDGAAYVEYAWVQLINAATLTPTTLFTARTTTGTNNTVPGNGLPGLAPGVTLVPATTQINAGQTTWSPLGSYSGACFAGLGQGCGSTGWIEMDYAIPAAGNYYLEFGVVNWIDQIYDSGLAFDGITIGGNPIDPTVPEPASLALVGLALAGLAATRRRRKA